MIDNSGQIPAHKMDEEWIPRKLAAAEVLARGGYEPGKRAPWGLCAAAATAAGVTPKTINQWKKDPDFIETVESLSGNMLLTAMDAMKRLMEDNSVSACQIMLEALYPDKFCPRTRTLKLKSELEQKKLDQMGELFQQLPKIEYHVPNVELLAEPKELTAIIEKQSTNKED